jgi:hypothetical protein
MANTTIPNLPATTSLTGPEELNVVQSNTSKYTTVAQIGAYVNANYPAQGITRITAAAPLSGGTITTTGTIGLTSNGVTNAYLATMSPYTIKANITSGTVAPTDATLTAILDTLGSTQGMTLYRGNTSWSTLPSSGTNTLLSVSGPNANPAWQTLSYMIDNAINSASAQGTILYRGASSWSALAPGTSGQILQTQGASANPQWTSVSGIGTVTSVNASGGSTGLNFTGGPITSSGTLTMGGTLGTGYGGTNLTSFTSGGAVYATSTSALTTGILPVASGGTGSSSPSLVAGTNVTISGSWPNQTINASGGGGSGTVTSVNVSGGTTGLTTSGGPITGSGTITLAGTLAIASGGTGQTTASAAFNALSPITSTGDLIIGNGTNSATRLGIGTNGYVLTSNGTTASWAASTGGVTSFSAGSTGLTPSTATTGAITLAGTLAVANGGTGVTTSSGANSVVLRDANANVTANYLFAGYSNTAAAGTTTTLTAASAFSYVVTGSGGQTFKLPDATTLSAGATYIFNNNQTSGTIVVQNNSATTVVTVQSGAVVYLTLLTNSVAAGTWDTHYQAPSNVTWSTNTFDYPGSITSATWNGVAVAINRGGTGQTTASAAFNALSPITATGDLIIGNGTNSATRLGIGTSGYVLTSNGTTASWVAPATNTYTRTSFTATAGQTSFTATYTVGYVQVYLNGVLLSASDYTATSGTAVVLSVAASSGDIVDVMAMAGGAPSGSGTVNSGTSGQLTYYASTGTAVSGATTGTGVVTALGVNTGSAGAFVVNGGALGTPSSGTLTNATGLPLTTGVTGILPAANGGTGVNNSSTLTMGGNVTFSGAFTQTLTATANTSVTLPVSGYLISTVTNMAANPVTGTPSSTTFLRGDGTWAAPTSAPPAGSNIFLADYFGGF